MTQEAGTRNLTEEELGQIGDWANDIENYGFFLSSYQDPRYADYDEVFYVGAGMDISHEYSSKEVSEEYLRLTGDEEVMADITVLKRSDIDQFLHRKVGIEVIISEVDDERNHIKRRWRQCCVFGAGRCR